MLHPDIITVRSYNIGCYYRYERWAHGYDIGPIFLKCTQKYVINFDQWFGVIILLNMQENNAINHTMGKCRANKKRPTFTRHTLDGFYGGCNRMLLKVSVGLFL